MPELFTLIKIKIKHGKDNLQYCTTPVQTCNIKETPKSIFILLQKLHLLSPQHLWEGEEGNPASANHQECLQNC